MPGYEYYVLLTSFKACDWSRHIFGASASPRPFTKKNWPCHPLPLFMAVSMSVRYQICDIRVAIACGIRGWRNLGWHAWTSSYDSPRVAPNICSILRWRGSAPYPKTPNLRSVKVVKLDHHCLGVRRYMLVDVMWKCKVLNGWLVWDWMVGFMKYVGGGWN